MFELTKVNVYRFVDIHPEVVLVWQAIRHNVACGDTMGDVIAKVDAENNLTITEEVNGHLVCILANHLRWSWRGCWN